MDKMKGNPFNFHYFVWKEGLLLDKICFECACVKVHWPSEYTFFFYNFNCYIKKLMLFPLCYFYFFLEKFFVPQSVCNISADYFGWIINLSLKGKLLSHIFYICFAFSLRKIVIIYSQLAQWQIGFGTQSIYRWLGYTGVLIIHISSYSMLIMSNLAFFSGQTNCVLLFICGMIYLAYACVTIMFQVFFFLQWCFIPNKC